MIRASRGICNPPTKQKGKHSPLLRITNPQSLNRLGHFLTPSGKNLRHPIDRTGLNLCKSVKSVGQKKSKSKNILRDLNNPAERLTER